MAKSGQKRKRADKAKTKLKTSKKKSIRLPKGLNVTKTEFSTQKLRVTNQVGCRQSGDSGDSRVTRKKIGFNDLAAKLGNLGVSTRAEGLEGLAELLKTYPELAGEHLGRLVTLTMALTTDREPKLRRLSRSILRTVFSLVAGNSNRVEPIFDEICAHLCCGLSHISVDVQLDSLQLLDDIVDLVPGFAAAKFDLLLPNCLDQVSLSRKTKTLINDKLTSLQWRVEVLTRICKIVGLVKDINNDKPVDEPNVNTKSWKQCCYMELDCDGYESNAALCLQEISNGRRSSKTFNFVDFLRGLGRILRDTWCEATNPPNPAAMLVVVDLLLSSTSKVAEFSPNVDIIMSGFPYVVGTDAVSPVEFNLKICALVLTNSKSVESRGADGDIVAYLSTLAIAEAKIAETVADILLMVADQVENPEDFVGLVDNLWRQFPWNGKIVELMSSLALSEGQTRLSSVDNWIRESLVEATKSTKLTVQQVSTMKSLFKRKDSTFFDAMKSNKILSRDEYKSLAVQQDSFLDILRGAFVT